MWRSVLLIGTILIIFVAALLSVISVLLDVPEGMDAGLNELCDYFWISSDAPSDRVPEGTPVYGHIDGITRYAIMSFEKSVIMTPHKEEVDEDDENVELDTSVTVTCFALKPSHADMLELYNSCLLQKSQNSRFPTAPGEAVVNADIAKLAGAKLGDTLTLSPDPYYADKFDKDVAPVTLKIVGVTNSGNMYNVNTDLAYKKQLTAAYIYFISEEDTQYDYTYYSFDNVENLHVAYNRALDEGRKVDTAAYFKTQFEATSLAQAFFGAVAAVLGIMTIFILYSLIAIFFRQRKGQICRLKLLGARTVTIATVYCTIVIVLVAIAVILGSFLSTAFNLYFMGLCARLFARFSANFVSHFRPIVQLIVFVVLSGFAVLIFFMSNRKIGNATIAREVRHE